MRLSYREGSIKWQVINLIYECGELPYKALHVLGRSNKSNQNQVKSMEKDGIVHVESLYKGKTIKLNHTEVPMDDVLFKNARKQYESVLSNTYYASEVKTITNATKERVSKRRRNLRLGKTTTFMYAAGMYVFSDGSIYKPNLLEKGLSGKETAFYLSTDIKKIFSEDEKRIPNRSLGILIYQTDIFPTYYIDNERQTIVESWERKAKRVLEYYLDMVSDVKLKNQREITKCMLLVDDYRLVKDMVMPEYAYDGYKKTKQSFKLADTYEKYYCFPYTRNGTKLCHAVLVDCNRLKNLPIKRKNRVEESESIEYNGREILEKDKTGKKMLYELSLFDCEIKKLYRFLEFIEFKEYRRKPGEYTDEYKIYCLDFQYEMLQGVLKECNRSKLVKLVSYSTELVLAKFSEKKERPIKQDEKSDPIV